MASKPRVKAPKKAKAGDVVTIKTLISHTMESGQRKDKKTGEIIPRKIINKFAATYNDAPVFSADINPAVSSNPYFEFSAKLMESGTFRFVWTDDDGTEYSKESKVKVS